MVYKRDYDKEYRAKNAARLREQRRAYYEANKERILKRHSEYRKANPDKIKQWRESYKGPSPEVSRDRARAYREANRDKVRERGRNRWRSRTGRPEPTRPVPDRCECCGRLASELVQVLSLDHCHSTGKFRGWLCVRCNLGIGSLGDNLESVLKAVKYLQRAEIL